MAEVLVSPLQSDVAIEQSLIDPNPDLGPRVPLQEFFDGLGSGVAYLLPQDGARVDVLMVDGKALEICPDLHNAFAMTAWASYQRAGYTDIVPPELLPRGESLLQKPSTPDQMASQVGLETIVGLLIPGNRRQYSSGLINPRDINIPRTDIPHGVINIIPSPSILESSTGRHVLRDPQELIEHYISMRQPQGTFDHIRADILARWLLTGENQTVTESQIKNTLRHAEVDLDFIIDPKAQKRNGSGQETFVGLRTLLDDRNDLLPKLKKVVTSRDITWWDFSKLSLHPDGSLIRFLSGMKYGIEYLSQLMILANAHSNTKAGIVFVTKLTNKNGDRPFSSIQNILKAMTSFDMVGIPMLLPPSYVHNDLTSTLPSFIHGTNQGLTVAVIAVERDYLSTQSI